MHVELEGKFAVVTGGGAGIGLAITAALRAAGTNVLIVGRSPERLAAARGGDTGITSFVADLAEERDRDRLIEHLADNRPLDVVVPEFGCASIPDPRTPLTPSHAGSTCEACTFDPRREPS